MSRARDIANAITVPEFSGNVEIIGTSPELTFETTNPSHYNFQISVQENVSGGLEISSGSADADSSNDTFTPRLVVLNGGNVGIGTINPSTQTHIAKTSTTAFSANNASWHDLLISNYGSATSNNVAGLAFQVSADGYASNAGTGICAVKNGTASDYGADLAFITRPQSAVAEERMRIDSTGNVGVGATSMAAKFVVQDGSLPKIQSNYNNAKHLDMGNGGSGCGFAMTTGHFMTFNHQPYADRGTDTNLTERMRIDSSGRVMIGTTTEGYAPNAELFTIANTASISSDAGMTIRAGSSGESSIYFSDATSGGGEYQASIWQNHGTNEFNIRTVDTMILYAGNDERMRITSSGNVGIGSTNSEEYPLFIKGSNISSGGGLATLCILDSGTAYNGTNPGGGITFRGKYNNSGSTTNFGTVQGVKENTTDGNYATALSFTTRSNGGNLIQRLRLASGGRVYTCDTQSGGPHRFHVNNRVSIAPNGSKTHTITGMYQGYATLKIGYADGNYQYAHFVAELGGHMFSSGNGYNATVVANSASTMSISVTKNNTSYVVTVNAGSNYAYGSIELSGGAFAENSGATYAFS